MMHLFSKLIILLYALGFMSFVMATPDSVVNGARESEAISEKQSDALFEAVETDDIKGVRKILSKNKAAVHARSPDGRTLLHSVRTVRAARLLLRHGADVHAKTPDGWTPLHMVSTVAIARQFLKYGAEVNVETESGTTPLFNKVHSSQWTTLPEYGLILEMAQFLMDHGARMNIKTSRYRKDIILFIEEVMYHRNSEHLSLDNLRTVRALIHSELADSVSAEMLQVLDTHIIEKKKRGSVRRRICSRAFRPLIHLNRVFK